MRWLRLHLLCALLLVAALLFGGATAGDAAPTVRIRLKRLSVTDRLDVRLDGMYTIEGSGTVLRLPDDAAVTFQVRDEQIFLYADGVRAGLGVTVRLTQLSTDGALLLNGGRRRYPGVLTLTVEGGQLIPTLALSVEDYLQGVVPYEMSNDFPLEALKAQAVCARTYALAHLSPEATYDMVDTTANQVFMGIDPANAQAIRAVQETAGIVCTIQGNLAVCYYAASNGGRTVLPGDVWPGESNEGYAVMDDPYDLENPESPVLKRALNKNGESVPQGFVRLLRQAVSSELKKQGMADADEAFRVDSLDALALKDESTLSVTFTWSGRSVMATVDPANPESTPVYGDYRSGGSSSVTLALQPTAVNALNLSIGGIGNELISIEESDDRYVVISRRYGHGVGMSQRGAQWMAAHANKTYVDILSFYYPGTELQRAPFGSQALPTMHPALAQTPAPAASPTPRPTLMPVTGDLPEGAWLASVEGIDEDSSLNLRADPSTAGDILMRLYKHQWLIVLNDCEEEGWVHVRTDSAEGYVMVSFLEKIAE